MDRLRPVFQTGREPLGSRHFVLRYGDGALLLFSTPEAVLAALRRGRCRLVSGDAAELRHLAELDAARLAAGLPDEAGGLR